MAQLVDAARGVQMWSERYDRPLHDIFALQDEVVKRIVTTLNLQLAVSEQGFLPPRRMTNSLEAYDLALRGMDYYSNLTKESNAKARQMFEEAVTLDPGYADAYAEIGVTYWWDWIWQWSADPMTLNRAFEAEQRAVQLDDQILELIRS